METIEEYRLECLRLAVASGACNPILEAQQMLEFIFSSPLDDMIEAASAASREAK